MARRHLNLLVAGGYDVQDAQALDKPVEEIVAFAKSLGAEIIKQGHTLLTGCQTELDRVVAEAAQGALGPADAGVKPSRPRVVSYVLQGQKPVHNFGVVVQSDLPDWDIGGLEPRPPEVIRNADAVILLGGFFGTFKAANWARLNRKPLLPFVSFGGAAKEVYAVEAGRFDKIYAANVDRLDYDQVLKSLSSDWGILATQTVALAERLVTTPSVFVVMSFKSSGQYKDLYASIQRVCKEFDYEAKRVDESNLFKRIIPEIMKQLRQCAFVIADVTEQKANVFYELGFADGVGKEVILVAKAGTDLPFDVRDVPVLFWDSFTEFEEELRKRVQHIGSWQGRA
jgi:predicted Rossmann-fold nucleotide-binding protein